MTKSSTYPIPHAPTGILQGFEGRGLIRRRPSESDGRSHLVSLTREGVEAFAALNAASHRDVEALVGRLSESDQRRLIRAMNAIGTLLGAGPEERRPFLLRPPESGDLEWVVERHGVLYRREYGWDERFEALVAGIVAGIVDGFDPRLERYWIAEKDGRNVGSVFLLRHPDPPEVARLRLLLVEPPARGLGIGTRLVQECTRFARESGYHTVTLWTNDVLASARRIYEREGYRLVEETPHRSFGQNLVGRKLDL